MQSCWDSARRFVWRDARSAVAEAIAVSAITAVAWGPSFADSATAIAAAASDASAALTGGKLTEKRNNAMTAMANRMSSSILER